MQKPRLLVLEMNYSLNNQPIRTSAVDYYRLIQPATHLQEWFEVEVRKDPFEGHSEKNWEEIVKNFDIIWTGYNIHSEMAYVHIRVLCLKYGKKLVIDLDDNIWQITPDNPVYPRLHKGTPDLHKITCILSDVEYVTATTPYLKSRILDETRNRNVTCFDNTVDIPAYDVKKQEHEGINLFYAGTQTHLWDVNQPAFKNALRRIFDEFPQVKLTMLGLYTLEYQKLFKGRFRHIPGDSDFPKYMDIWKREVATADIALAPLIGNDFTRCKTAVKYYEYSANAIPTIASNVQPYRKVIEPGNGILCSSEEEWYQALKRLIENEQERREMGERAKEWVKANRNPQGMKHKYHDFFQGILTDAHTHSMI